MAGYCNCQENALKLYKGYPSEFADVDWLSIVFESEPIDLTNFEAKFVLGNITREWGDITQGIIINLTDEETGSLPVGMNYGTLIVTDKDCNSKPFSTAIPIDVLTWVEGDQELDTYNMTVNALLDNEVEMVIRIETAKVSLDWVLEKIAEHNASEGAHPYIQGLIDAEAIARENADSALSDRIDENTRRFDNYRTNSEQDVIDNAQNVEINKKQDKLDQNQLNAINSGITASKVRSYDSHIENTTIHVTSGEKQTWSSKQNALNQEQMDAVNSGANSEKIEQIAVNTQSVSDEITNRENADSDLQDQINNLADALNEKQDELIEGDGIDITNNIISNSGVRSVSTGSINGTISINTNGVSQNVSVYGLGSAAYTASTDYATSAQGTLANSALQPSDVINNTSSNDIDMPLSAAMGKSLQDQVDNLKARGRFLALWNCVTGLAESNPPTGTYTYQSGDYFIIGVVAQSGGTNYRPNGSSYTTGVASTTVETETVDVADVYYYDGSVWRLQVNTQKTISFVNIAGSPYDNTSLASALNSKQDDLTTGSGIDITNNTISNTGVLSVSTGSSNGTVSVNTNGTSADISVYGLGSAAFTDSTDYATSSQGAKADTAVQPATLNNYVTLNTLQTLTSGKKVFANDAVMAGNQTALLATISNSSTYTTDNAWVGRYICGAKNLTFLMGTYRTMAGIGAHSWTNAQTGSGASWADFYLNPDGSNAVYIGGNLWTKNSGWMKIKNSGNSNGTVQVNRGTISSTSWKNVACWGDNISNFVNNSGYITGITSSDVTTALGYTPYNSNNPSGYQANVIETVKVNGTELTPTDKAVDITVPTVNDPTITITQGGVTKGSFTLNQSTGDSIELDAGGGSVNPTTNVLPVKNASDGFSDSQLKQTSDGRSIGIFGEPDASTPYDKYFSVKGGRVRCYAGAANAYILQGYTDGSANSAIINAVRSGNNDSGAQMIFGICNGSNSWAGSAFSDSVFFGSLKDSGGQALKPMKFVVNASGGGTPQLTIATNGNVGIKKTNPAYDFDVNGTVNASTDIKINGSTINPKSFSGYSASKTQTLKNINGKLTWVDD